MGITRGLAAFVVGAFVAIGVVPITNALGGYQRAWMLEAGIIGVFAVIGAISAFFANKEQNAGR